MKRSSIFSIDLYIVGAVIILIIIGVLFILSANTDTDGQIYNNEFIKQLVWAGIGLPLLFFFAFFNYQRLRDISLFIYIVIIVLLILTRLVGQVANRAHSWLGIGSVGIQPSEFSKIAVILFLGDFLARVGNKIRELPYFLLAFLICLAPMGLILWQPDMGTALVFIPIFFAMTWMAGTKKRYIVFVFCAGFFMVVMSMIPEFQKLFFRTQIPFLSIFTETPYMLIFDGIIVVVGAIGLIGYIFLRDRIFYWIMYVSGIIFSSSIGSYIVRHIFDDYSTPKIRLIIFLNPYVDDKKWGWHIINSITAVGSGGIWGKGFLGGTQSKLKYVPEQSTDFIFSIISEELGLLGGLVILALYFLIFHRSINIIKNTSDNYAHLIGTGIIAMFLYHCIINIGMTMGLMPITGIPLFFLSYGGSSLLTGLVSIGIILNIYYRRYS